MEELIAPKLELKMVKEAGISYDAKVTSPKDVANVVRPFLENQPQERFLVVPVNSQNQVVGVSMVYQGTVNTAVIRIAEVIRPAILTNATAFFIAHNHPSGTPTPSPEDVAITKRIREAGELIQIELLDHIIIGDEGNFTSLKERGLGF